ncbi:MAG: UvrD-helicase domain-containing protein [Chlamydiota bacterium]
MQLNKEQQKAVEATEGRILVLAGAGSGKTRVIVHRIAYLIKQKKVAPSAILGLTFTNKAAEEMRERVSKEVGSEIAKKITLSTFHSFCMHILRKHIQNLGYTSNFSLYDEKDKERLATQIAREILQNEKDIPSIAQTLHLIGEAKNKGISFEEIPKVGSDWHHQFMKELYQRLDVSLRACNAVDFDNLLSLTVQLFEKHPAIAAIYQNTYKYVMIDEYQDTNPIQSRLAELLVAPHQNLFVVGDDDQSIYGWRGASIEHILQFTSDITIKLEQNYRSTSPILAAANAVIHNNKNRHDKSLWTSQSTGEKITLFHAPTDLEEAEAVVQKMISLYEQGKKWKDMAILYRSNILSRNFEMALLQAVYQKDGKWIRGIPYEIFGGLEFAERSEIKDTMSYLRVIANPLDQEALLRIINVPRRGISDQTLDTLTKYQRGQKISLWSLLKKIAIAPLEKNKEEFSLQPRAIKGIVSFVDIIETAQKRFENRPFFSALEWFLEAIDYKKAIEEEVKTDKVRDFKQDNIQEFINALSEYEESEENPTLQNFLSTTLLSKENLRKNTQTLEEDRIKLMTFHSAKGLEFPVCFLVGLEDHILPHEKSIQDRGVEEERRLFYVGITRAREHLIFSMARSRRKMGKYIPTNPSRFLEEIPKELFHLTSWKQLY